MLNRSASLTLSTSSNPCLVNFLSKDTHLVFSIYNEGSDKKHLNEALSKSITGKFFIMKVDEKM